MTQLTETPRTLTSLVSSQLREKIANLPDRYLNKSEHEIINTIQEEFPDWKQNELDFGIKMNLWDEYNWAQKHGMQMRMTYLYEGVCEQQTFSYIVNTPHRLAYIITPFFSEAQKRKRALSVLWKEMVEIMDMKVPINSKTGVPEPKIISLKVDLFKFLYAYQHGQPIQKIQQETKNLNYNVDATTQEKQLTPAEIDERIRLLEAKESLPQAMEVLPVESVVRDAGRVSEEFKR